MNWLRSLWLFAAILLLTLLANCASNVPVPQPAPIPAPTLVAYASRTPSVTTLVFPTFTATNIPTFTPTPISYTIARGDTLSSIARREGITVEALLAANPGVAPQSLSVGQVITIPTAAEAAAGVSAVSTPAPVDIGEVRCLPSAGGTECLIPFHNPYPETLENVKAQVSLLDAGGKALASQEVILPLDILPAGKVLPAAAFFKDISVYQSTRVQLLTSVRLLPGDARYLQTDLSNLLVSIAWDGLSANVRGQILIPSNGKPAAVIWMVAVAYDSSGQITGFRRWDWSGVLKPGQSQPFATTVYSPGAFIDHVEVLVEARP